MELADLERVLLARILGDDAPEYLWHVPLLKIASREFTGAGFSSNFAYGSAHETASEGKRTLGLSLVGRFRDLDPPEAGFILSIDNGRVTNLEVFAHGLADWPGRIDVFELIELRSRN
jgi:hypothetical protein